MKTKTFLRTVKEDTDFRLWVDKINPPSDGIQQVFLAEAFAILKLLWEIYQILKGLGVFTSFFKTRKLKATIRNLNLEQKEAALTLFKAELSQ